MFLLVVDGGCGPAALPEERPSRNADSRRISEAALALLLAFLAGGVVLNVLKEELPEERESRLGAFAAGSAAYAALLMAI